MVSEGENVIEGKCISENINFSLENLVDGWLVDLAAVLLSVVHHLNKEGLISRQGRK